MCAGACNGESNADEGGFNPGLAAMGTCPPNPGRPVLFAVVAFVP